MEDYSLYSLIENLLLESQERELLEAQARDLKSLNNLLKLESSDEEKIKKIEQRIKDRKLGIQKIENARNFSNAEKELKEIANADYQNYKNKK